MISTISIAEKCVGSFIHKLPVRNLQTVLFNLDHLKRNGKFAKIVNQNKEKLRLKQPDIIVNDTKLFAQAATIKAIEFFLSAVSDSLKIFSIFKQETAPRFQFIDFNT